MRRTAIRLALAAILAASAGCDGDAGDGAVSTLQRGDDLEDFPLRVEEAPDGLEENPRGTGPVAGIREVLPPRRTAPNLPAVPRELARAFEAGYQRLLTEPGARGRSAASSALRFSGEDTAARFFDLLGDIHEATLAEDGLAPAPNLGAEGYGWSRTVPGAETGGVVWRRGDLVLTLSLTGPIDQVDARAVLELARTVDGRLG